MTAVQPPDRPRDGRAVVVYTVARVGMLAVCFALLWLAGLTGPVLIIAALLLSGLLSWFLLQRPRRAMSDAVARRVDSVRDRAHERTAAEDAYADALQGSTLDRKD